MREKWHFLFVGSALFQQTYREYGNSIEAPEAALRRVIAIGSIEAQTKLVAINAGAQKWPDIVRLRDAGKLILEACDCDISSLGECSYEDSLGRAWIIDPAVRSIQPKSP